MPSRTLRLSLAVYGRKRGPDVRMRVVHGRWGLDGELSKCEYGGISMAEDNVAAVALGAVDGIIVTKNIVSYIGHFVGEHAAVAAGDFEVEITWVDLTVAAVSALAGNRRWTVVVFRVDFSSLALALVVVLDATGPGCRQGAVKGRKC